MFNVGGWLGLFAWAYLFEIWNWRLGLILGGVIGLVLFGFGQFAIPKDRTVPRARGSMRLALKSRNIMIIAVGVVGIWGGIFTASQFLPDYLQGVHNISTGESGLIASLIMLAAIIGGPIGGKLSDRTRRRKIFMIVPGLAVAVGLALIGPSQIAALWLLIPIIGFMDAIVFSTEYASASQYPEVGKAYAPLAISVINAAQILGSFWIPITFSYLGYSSNWYFLGLAAAVFLIPMFWLQEPFKANTKSSS
jgi:predicted MFS family arabinose efflux permease